jgi:hypothetical protein
MTVKEELKEMWREAVVAYFTVLSQHLLDGLRITMKNRSQISSLYKMLEVIEDIHEYSRFIRE